MMRLAIFFLSLDCFAGYSILNKNKDTVTQNDVVIIIKERRMNKQEMIERDMKYYK